MSPRCAACSSGIGTSSMQRQEIRYHFAEWFSFGERIRSSIEGEASMTSRLLPTSVVVLTRRTLLFLVPFLVLCMASAAHGSDALQALRQKAESGDAPTQLALGKMYQRTGKAFPLTRLRLLGLGIGWRLGGKRFLPRTTSDCCTGKAKAFQRRRPRQRSGSARVQNRVMPRPNRVSGCCTSMAGGGYPRLPRGEELGSQSR